ncbi:hypothetical protein [Hymenobacter sp. BT188]|uniref:hypothetical protein n=1 Tax=Hymenobacter sp. BT188 TaxID=2763504 RepID=UPI0016518159|nr:hypothetical protein [Hymenobacter sp. BT188]
MLNIYSIGPWRALLVILCLGMLVSCQKPTDGPTLVEGQVVEHMGRQPVGGATVQVWRRVMVEVTPPWAKASLLMRRGVFVSASRLTARVATSLWPQPHSAT